MKKLLAILLSAVMLLGMVPLSVGAESWSIPMADAPELSLELSAPATTVTVPISDRFSENIETKEMTISCIEAGATITWPEGYTYMYLECFCMDEEYGSYTMYSGGFGAYPGMGYEVPLPATCVTEPAEPDEDGTLWAENYIYKFTTAKLEDLGQEYERDITVSVDYIMITEPTASSTDDVYTPIELGDFTQALSGKGWSYDPATVTLTLDNYNLPMPEDGVEEIYFDNAPDGFTISLTDGSVNVMPIVWSGGFKVVGQGSLTMAQYYDDLELDCAQFHCGQFFGGELTIRGGNASFGRTKATSQITVYGGDAAIDDLDVYKLQILGGNVTAQELHNCNGTSPADALFEVTGGSLTLERGDSEEPYLFSTVLSNFAEDPDFLTNVKALMENVGTCLDGSGNPLHFEYLGDNGDYADGELFCKAVLVDAEGNSPSTIVITSLNAFTDVTGADFFYDPVLWAVKKGVTNGYGSDTIFAPNVDCTRGQVVTFLWRAQGCPEPTITENPFADVKEDDYFYKAVLWALENEITTGLSATKFGSDAICTRGQVATFLWRSAGKPMPTSSNNPFQDVAEKDYFYNAVLWAVEKGVTNGYGNDYTFAPDGNCNRGQIVTFLYRALK